MNGAEAAVLRRFLFGAQQGVDRLAAEPVRGREAACLLGLAVMAATVLAWRWVGYQGTDDAYYATAAISWVERFPPLGDDHWSLRYPVVLPTALFLRVLGPGEFSLAAANLAYFVALLAVTYAGCRRFLGWPVAVLACAALVLMPAVVVQGTYANPDLPEALFAVASFWCFLEAASRGGGAGRWLVLAGVLAGLAFLTREISVALVAFYVVLFLAWPQMARIRYLLMAAGFLAMVGVQMADFAVRAGDPLYRYRISAQHDSPDRALVAPRAAGQVLDAEGVLAAGAVLTPVSALMLSQKFGLLFWLALPGALVVARSRRCAGPGRRAALLAGLLALVWFLFVALNAAMLYVVPRYFMAAGIGGAVLAAAGLVALWRAGWPMLAGLAAAGFAASSVLLLYLENTDPLHAEHLLVEVAAGAGETVYADPRTAGRAALLLQLRGLAVQSTPPPAGALVAVNPRAGELCRTSRYCGARERMAHYEIRPEWRLVRALPAPTRWIGVPIRALGINRFVPNDIMRKVETPYEGLEVYRIPPG